MHKGNATFGFSKHRKGGHGKNARSMPASCKRAIERDTNSIEKMRDRIRAAKKKLQDIIPIQEWFNRNRGAKAKRD